MNSFFSIMKLGGEAMEVYVEITYVVNAFLILLSFEILCFLLSIKMSVKELVIYTFSYNFSLFFLYIDLFDGFIFLYNLLLTTLYFRKQTYIYYPIYMFVYISLLSFIQFILPQSLIFQGILLIEGMSGFSYFIVGILCLLIGYFYITFCNYKISQNDVVDVVMDKQCLKGLVDNGNKTFYKGYPLIFVLKSKLNDYQVIDHIEVMTATDKEDIEIIELYDIDIHHHHFKHLYAGVLTHCEYDCILNTQLMGGLL